jgi:hypothetical protein
MMESKAHLDYIFYLIENDYYLQRLDPRSKEICFRHYAKIHNAPVPHPEIEQYLKEHSFSQKIG